MRFTKPFWDGIADASITPRLVIVTREPDPHIRDGGRFNLEIDEDAWGWGETMRKYWTFAFYEFLPDGGFEAQRLNFPESARSLKRRQDAARRAGYLPPTMRGPLADFHPAVRTWFERRFALGPTEAQARGWPAIAKQRDTLIAAPTMFWTFAGDLELDTEDSRPLHESQDENRLSAQFGTRNNSGRKREVIKITQSFVNK